MADRPTPSEITAAVKRLRTVASSRPVVESLYEGLAADLAVVLAALDAYRAEEAESIEWDAEVDAIDASIAALPPKARAAIDAEMAAQVEAAARDDGSTPAFIRTCFALLQAREEIARLRALVQP